MGSLYQPYCHSCNYNFREILVGVGMRGPENHYGPAVCYLCNRLSQKNLNVEHLTCSRCRKEMEVLPIDDEKHTCPKCGEKTLELMLTGLWD